jgi:hypothetical protein
MLKYQNVVTNNLARGARNQFGGGVKVLLGSGVQAKALSLHLVEV